MRANAALSIWSTCTSCAGDTVCSNCINNFHRALDTLDETQKTEFLINEKAYLFDKILKRYAMGEFIECDHDLQFFINKWHKEFLKENDKCTQD